MRNQVQELTMVFGWNLKNAKAEHIPSGYFLYIGSEKCKKGDLYLKKNKENGGFELKRYSKPESKEPLEKVLGCSYEAHTGISSHPVIIKMRERDIQIYNKEFKSEVGYLYYDDATELQNDIRIQGR